MRRRRLDIVAGARWPGRDSLPWLLPGALILLAAAGGDAARIALRYQRDAVFAGEYWRLATGHLVHLGWSHAVLNLAGLVAIWLLCARELTPRGWVVVLLTSAAVIDAGFIVLDPDLFWYVGFSGVLHGLFAAGVVCGVRARQRDMYLLGALLVAKLAWETWLGPLPLTEGAAGGPVVEQAHLYGAVAGAAAGLMQPRRAASGAAGL